MNVFFTEGSLSVSNTTTERSFQTLSALNFQSYYLNKDSVIKIPYLMDDSRGLSWL